jgi:hypothetical protein
MKGYWVVSFYWARHAVTGYAGLRSSHLVEADSAVDAAAAARKIARDRGQFVSVRKVLPAPARG